MSVAARRHRLLHLVRERGFLSLGDLVTALACSESTVRRDLDYWHDQGALQRTHGGALFTGSAGAWPSLEERSTTCLAEKRYIAQAAATHIQDGQAILLDGGTTTLEIAKQLVGRSLQVVTNSLPIAQVLTGSRDIDLILLGGYVYPKTGVALGPQTILQLQHIHVHQAFLGAGGITPEQISNSNLLLVETEQAMMQAADEIVVVTDHTKLDRTALVPLCPLSTAHTLIIDDGLSDVQRRWLRTAGPRLQIAPRLEASA